MAGGFVVVEAIKEDQPLIEMSLRVGVLGRDRMLIIAEPGMKLHRLGRRTAMRVLRRRPMAVEGQRENEKNY
jgi:hypothetical protein